MTLAPSEVRAAGDLAPDVQALAGAYPDYVAALARNRRWNFAANILDSSIFASYRCFTHPEDAGIGGLVGCGFRYVREQPE